MNTPATPWYEIQNGLFSTLRATGWTQGSIGAGYVSIQRSPACSAPAGRGAEVVAIMRAAIEAHGYRVRVSRRRLADGTRCVQLDARA
jgi:hypothetical protein